MVLVREWLVVISFASGLPALDLVFVIHRWMPVIASIRRSTAPAVGVIGRW